MIWKLRLLYLKHITKVRASVGFTCIIVVMIFSACFNELPLTDYDVIFEQTMGYGYGENDIEPFDEQAILIYDRDDYDNFLEGRFDDEAFFIRDDRLKKFPFETIDEDKSIIYIQMEGEKTKCPSYWIENVSVTHNKVTIEVKAYGNNQISPGEGFTGNFYYIMFIELSKDLITPDTQVELVVLESP